jgi:hypothetical protein
MVKGDHLNYSKYNLIKVIRCQKHSKTLGTGDGNIFAMKRRIRLNLGSNLIIFWVLSN